MANESEFLWENDKDFKVPNGRVLARLVKSNGLMYKEVKLEAGLGATACVQECVFWKNKSGCWGPSRMGINNHKAGTL